MAFLEIACFTTESALIAASSGASRIELCTDGHLGGTTPLLSTFQSLRSKISSAIPIYVMIRPRGGGFTYSEPEFQQMRTLIQTFASVGADGFVFGILDERHLVDETRCVQLVAQAAGRPCTFHRAFDEILPEAMEKELEVLVRCGFRAILTSGGMESAAMGKERLGALVRKAKATGGIEVIVGGGVRSGNVEMLRRQTGAEFFHSSAIVRADGAEVASQEEVKLLRESLAK
jgi:copper homeostasis protein